MEVRAATVTDTDDVIAVLTASFVDDPMLGWAFPDRRTRRHRLDALWRFVAGGVYLPGGACTVGVEDGEIVAAALWRRPDDLDRSEAFFAERGEDFVVALDGELDRLTIVTAAMTARHPSDPHWYLLAVGVDPRRQGGGRGGRLLEHTLDRIDASANEAPTGSGAAYLEATSARSRVLYRRLGFADLDSVDISASAGDIVTGDINAGDAPTLGISDAPTIWMMWRASRSSKPPAMSADS